jgi:hypothetical protein
MIAYIRTMSRRHEHEHVRTSEASAMIAIKVCVPGSRRRELMRRRHREGVVDIV